MQTTATPPNAHAGMKPPRHKILIMNAAIGMSISEDVCRNAMPADLASYTKHVGEIRLL